VYHFPNQIKIKDLQALVEFNYQPK
jgi:hypothetical protein